MSDEMHNIQDYGKLYLCTCIVHSAYSVYIIILIFKQPTRKKGFGDYGS